MLVIPFQETFGHAFVTSSNPSSFKSVPSPPSKIDVFFSEPVDLRYSKLSVLDQDGKQVDNKDIHYLNGDQSSLSVTVPKLKDGVYTVSTSVLSQTDGHVTDNAFVFALGDASIPANASSATQQESEIYVPEAVSRFPTLVGQVIIVGAAFSGLWLWVPIHKFRKFAAQTSELRKGIDKRLSAVFIIGAICLVGSNIAILVFQALSISAGIQDVISTRFGIIIMVRIFLSLVVLGISLLLRRKPTNLSKTDLIGILALGLVLLFTTSMIGHGAANNQFSSIAIDFVHNITASLWIGGVFYFGLVFASKLKADGSLEKDLKVGLLAIIIPRFSLLVIIILGFIIFTGPLLLFLLDNNLAQVLSSLYGKTLIAKLILALAMLLVGAYNQFAVQKVAQKQASSAIAAVSITSMNKEYSDYHYEDGGGNGTSKDNGDNREKKSKKYGIGDIISKFSRTTKVETILGILLLGSVAFLVNTGVPASESPQSQSGEQNSLDNITFQQSQDGYKSTYFASNNSQIILSILPFTIGSNNFTVSFVDWQNQPIDIASASIQYTEPEKSIGPIRIDLEKVSKGVFKAIAAFGIPGLWDLEIEGIPNAPNLPAITGTFNDLRIKPLLEQFQFNITEYNTPSNLSQPLYPVYDRSRNSIWVGDTAIDSSQILEFKIATKEFVGHRINGTSIITIMALDGNNTLWFIDPITKVIGNYNPASQKYGLIKLPKNIVPSGLAVDPNDKLWIASSATSQILVFNPKLNTFEKVITLESGARPLSIAISPNSGLVWVSDETGKLIMIDPLKNYNSTSFAPTAPNSMLKSPTGLLLDDVNEKVYISQHEGQRVTAFDTILRNFQDYPPLNPDGLPFGMALDKYGYLWVAEHTINKLGVIDPQTGANKELAIPNPNPFVQWITSDSNGDIWIAEQRGHSLGIVTSVVSSPNIANLKNQTTPIQSETNTPLVNYNFVAVAVVIGLVLVSLIYVKNVIDCRVAEKTIGKYESIED